MHSEADYHDNQRNTGRPSRDQYDRRYVTISKQFDKHWCNRPINIYKICWKYNSDNRYAKPDWSDADRRRFSLSCRNGIFRLIEYSMITIDELEVFIDDPVKSKQ